MEKLKLESLPGEIKLDKHKFLLKRGFSIEKIQKIINGELCLSCHKRVPEKGFKTCPKCLEARKGHYNRNRDKYKTNARQCRLKKYGITSEEYQSLYKLQGGVCAICFRPPNGRMLSVDHDHETKKIRGLLCDNCNHGIGVFKEDLTVFYSAIAYLKSHTMEQIGGQKTAQS